jgi:hypothetical protein
MAHRGHRQETTRVPHKKRVFFAEDVAEEWNLARRSESFTDSLTHQ